MKYLSLIQNIAEQVHGLCWYGTYRNDVFCPRCTMNPYDLSPSQPITSRISKGHTKDRGLCSSQWLAYWYIEINCNVALILSMLRLRIVDRIYFVNIIYLFLLRFSANLEIVFAYKKAGTGAPFCGIDPP